jgi:hypothetical protein
LKLGSSPIIVLLSRSNNAIVEPKPEQDPVEDVLMASLEDMAQPALDNENFIQEEEELAEPVELDQTEKPSPPSIELKPLPFGLIYVFLNDNQETHVIISDKLSHDETHKLVAILERHKLAIGYSLQDLKGISPTLYTHRIPIDPDSSPSRNPNGDLTTLYERLLRKRSSNSYTLGLSISCHIASGLALSRSCKRKEG